MNEFVCGTCLYFIENTQKPGSGQCRRNPPVAVVTRYVSDTIVDNGKVYQVLNGIVSNLVPVVDAGFVCGHFIKRSVVAGQTEVSTEAVADETPPLPGEKPLPKEPKKGGFAVPKIEKTH